MAPKTDVIEQLRARIVELEEENARLKAESRDACFGLNDYYGRKLAAAQEECEFQRNAHKQAEELMLEQSNQLAAEQLNNKLLREHLRKLIELELSDAGALSTDELCAEFRHAAIAYNATPISTEALDAYVAEKVKEAGKFDVWKTNPYTKVLETSIKQLTRQRDLAVEALEAIAKKCNLDMHGDDGSLGGYAYGIWNTANSTLSIIKESDAGT